MQGRTKLRKFTEHFSIPCVIPSYEIVDGGLMHDEETNDLAHSITAGDHPLCIPLCNRTLSYLAGFMDNVRLVCHVFLHLLAHIPHRHTGHPHRNLSATTLQQIKTPPKLGGVFIYSSRMVMLVITGCASLAMLPLLSVGSAASQTASTTSIPSVTRPKAAYCPSRYAASACMIKN